MKKTNLEAIAYHLEQGEDNGGISRDALALFLRSVAKELKSAEQTNALVAGRAARRIQCVTVSNKSTQG